MDGFKYKADLSSGLLFLKFDGLTLSTIWHTDVVPLAFRLRRYDFHAILLDFRTAQFAKDWGQAFSDLRGVRIGAELVFSLLPKQVAFAVETDTAKAVAQKLVTALAVSDADNVAEYKVFRAMDDARSWLNIPDSYEINYSDSPDHST